MLKTHRVVARALPCRRWLRSLLLTSCYRSWARSFSSGFKEAINIAVVLVAVYLALSAVITSVALFHVVQAPHLFVDWKHALYAQHGSLLAMIGISLVLFPKLSSIHHIRLSLAAA
jgi:hypothetical protein